MGILLWIIFGGLVGWVASMMVGTDAKQGAMGNIILGGVGAVLGGFLSTLFGFDGITGFNLYSGLIALLGALAAVGIGRVFKFA